MLLAKRTTRIVTATDLYLPRTTAPRGIGKAPARAALERAIDESRRS